jgi:hypothetical protein
VYKKSNKWYYIYCQSGSSLYWHVKLFSMVLLFVAFWG